MTGEGNIDLMFGGLGTDTMEGELGGTLITINGVPVRFGNLMFGGSEDDTMTSGGDFDLMFGNDGDDLMHGGNGNDLMFGNLGNDTISGGWDLVLDIIFGGDGDDTIFGEDGFDVVFGNEDFAGTDPRDATDAATTPAALFERIGKVVNAQVTPAGFRITRLNGPNPRPLRVRSSTTLGGWDNLMDIVPTGPSTTVTLPMDAAAKFYRFVENPPLP